MRPSEEVEPKDALAAFCKLLEENSELQLRVKASKTPWEILEIAASTGNEISYAELRTWSRELSADYFPWATMGNEWRRNFFSQKT